MGIAEDAGILGLQQLFEHQAAALRHLGHAHALGKALGGIEFAQAANTGRGIWQASAGKAPGTDGRADQGALAWRAQ